MYFSYFPSAHPARAPDSVKRIEPWEISQTEHATCVAQFLEKNGLLTIWKSLAATSGWEADKFQVQPALVEK